MLVMGKSASATLERVELRNLGGRTFVVGRVSADQTYTRGDFAGQGQLRFLSMRSIKWLSCRPRKLNRGEKPTRKRTPKNSGGKSVLRLRANSSFSFLRQLVCFGPHGSPRAAMERRRWSSIGIGLGGLSGFGQTSLAVASCADRRSRRRGGGLGSTRFFRVMTRPRRRAFWAKRCRRRS